jgi:site-specific DNA-methyltransferase (adenine-specific)
MDQNIPINQIISLDQSYKYDKDQFELLKKSIEINGLFHSVILQETFEYPGDFIIESGNCKFYKIIAGRARFLALKELGKTEILAKVLPYNCSNPHEIALHENLRRNNLPWYEQVELEKELHDLRTQQHGEKKKGRPFEGDSKQGWSQNDTARELGLALGTFSQDMALATELQKNPYLRDVKDKSTALKIIRQINKQQIAEIEQMLPSELELDDILLGDSAVILKSFPNDTFDACITDPLWSEYKDEELRSAQDKFLPIYFELFRVLKRDSFLIIITSSTDFPFYIRELPKIGFRVQSYPIIWQKTKTITYGRAPWQFARDYEPIVVAVKGDPILTVRTEMSSILKFDNLHYSKMIHPHEKPIELIENIIKLITNPGAKIIDPFAGSFVVCEACRKTDRRFIGIDINKEFYDKGKERLNL